MSGKLTHPFPKGWIPDRLDMGYDGTFAEEIVALTDFIVMYASDDFSNWGGWLELTNPSGIPYSRHKTLYFAEGLRPVVRTGEHVHVGQRIAVPALSPYGDAYGTTRDGSGQIEWGVAIDGPVGQPTNPLGTIARNPRKMVMGFANWAVHEVGLQPPTSTNHAGHF